MKRRHGSAGLFFGMLLLAGVLAGGCRSLPPMSPADLSAPGWRVQQGQAVWTPPQQRPELAGDVLFATNTNGNFFIQFSKTPFVIATAELADGQWEIRFGANRYTWRGRGQPPPRFIWFQLPRAMAGDQLNDGWKFAQSSGNPWRLENTRTGETLAGQFFP